MSATAHRARLAPYVEPHLARRSAGVEHPVHDFLFTYYRFPPTRLLDWQPGWPDSGTPELLERRRDLVTSTLDLLRATASRPATFGCFGLHEWAMVHRVDRTRHPVPLRLGADGTDAVVESHRIACSHFDAFRFFTPSARPLNRLQPGPDDRAAHEQPGCLHATMDLYRHAFRLWPLVGSDLVADCFLLAWDVRTVDMRAAPYDLTAWGLEPIRIETPEGKQEYAAAQRGFAERSAPLRDQLIAACEQLVAALRPGAAPQWVERSAMGAVGGTSGQRAEGPS
ncbi:3-methyladenine DNA glycosylase [Nocardioides cynanchi]|uniref:3-methyladenine DNA glycosylase n=1 Tax=Nocardioides cynanchi TaxID=2558918 RepID=UPI001EE2D5CC|nr:3-methyladenine DNA glycosylase [Nocardioides cynanchi]